MKDLALIDADIVAHRVAATCEGLKEDIAEVRINDLMQRILFETNASTYKAYLTGSNNFRYEIYPEYKANRKDKPKPTFLEHCREYLVTQWKAKVTDGNEADDELGIEQTAQGDNSVICTIDKDLLQVPGYHFDFVKGIARYVSPLDGLRSFYSQVIQGDGSDNIPAFDGKMRSATPKFVQKLLDPLNELTKEVDMYNYCADIFQDHWQEKEMPGESITWEFDLSIMHRNAQCLWIQRQENQKWQQPLQQT